METRGNQQLVRALVERWCDTTNSFHFRFGVMTITPLDFAATTGLKVGGDPIPFDSGLYLDRAAIRHYLGREMGDEPMVRCDHLPALWDHVPKTDLEVRQMARAYLLYMFGQSLFPNRQHMVHLGWLPALGELETVGRFDWGGSALCMLYCFLGSVVRGAANTIVGYWRILEIWAYEVFGVPSPENFYHDDRVLPRAMRWGKGSLGKKVENRDLRFCRLFFDRSMGETVRWDVWNRLDRPFLAKSRTVTRGRILLESPYGWQWYLGDRVARQSWGLGHFRLPASLPSRILRTYEYTLAEIETYTVLDMSWTFHPSVAYDQYVTTTLAHDLHMEARLAGPVPVEDAALPVARREIEVMTAGGVIGVIDIPRVTDPVVLTAREFPVKWVTSQVELVRDLEALVRRLMIGNITEVRPGAELGIVPPAGDDYGGDGGDDGAGGGYGDGGVRRGGRSSGGRARGECGGGRAGGGSRGARGSRGAGGESGSRRRPRRDCSVGSETDQPGRRRRQRRGHSAGSEANQDVLPSPPRRTRPLMKNAGGGPVHIQPSAPVSDRVLRSSRSSVEGPGS